MGLGILLSRISGLIRERIFAYYFGNSEAADAFKAALKIPNFLQNLFGEGVLSASFIPVYAELLAKKHDEEASKVASVVGSLLFLVTSFFVLAGVFLTPSLISLIAPGFEREKRALTIELVQILFPGTGFLVMSAWCLGILNSHKKFFLSYVAPVIWNLSIIVAMVAAGLKYSMGDLAVITAYGLVVGSFLQFLVQIPFAWKLAGKLRPSISLHLSSIRMVLKNFVPVVFSRGVVQVSSYIDNILASLLPTGAVSALSYAQTLYLLPVSLFGMSVSASELPTMSQAQGEPEEVKAFLVQRLNLGFKRLLFFIAPSILGFLFLGDLIVGALFKTGAFGDRDVHFVWMVLAGYSLGLLMATKGRLYSSSFYAIKDARTPLKFALVRVLFSAGGGYIASTIIPPMFNLDVELGTVGLTISASIATAVEYYLLKIRSRKILGASGVPILYSCKVWFCAFFAGIGSWGLHQYVKLQSWDSSVFISAVLCVGVFGLIYFISAYWLRIEQAQYLVHRIKSKILR